MLLYTSIIAVAAEIVANHVQLVSISILTLVVLVFFF